MHKSTPRRYSPLSASRSFMQVPRTPSPKQQNRSLSPKPIRVLSTRAVLGRPEIVSPTPAARVYAIRFHRRRGKGNALALRNRDKASQAHRLLYKSPTKPPASVPSLVVNSKASTTTARLRASKLSIGPGDISHEPLVLYEDQLCTANQTKPRSGGPSFKNGMFREISQMHTRSTSSIRFRGKGRG